MRLPNYWAKESFTGTDDRGRQQTFVAWGWSFNNIDEARQEARNRASRIFNYLVQGVRPDNYPYLETPLREEVLQSVDGGQGQIGVITRNRYGAMVLNAASVLFADIDFPDVKPSGGGGLKKLFGKKSDAPVMDAATMTLNGVKNWAGANPGRSFRVYRTKAGLRLLFTDKLYEPKSDETAHLLLTLGSDPMYRLLTNKQESFRARLTPKPWRCQCPNPPNRFPFENAQAEQQYRQWEQEYARQTAAYRTCELVEVVGRDAAIDDIAAMISVHDSYALRGGGAGLA